MAFDNNPEANYNATKKRNSIPALHLIETLNVSIERNAKNEFESVERYDGG